MILNNNEDLNKIESPGLYRVDDERKMTASEAVRRIKKHNEIHSKKECQAILITEALNMAVGALEKQIPYKPKEYEDKFYACKCGNVLLMKWKKYPTELTPKSEGLPYCLGCGQKIDWSDEE